MAMVKAPQSLAIASSCTLPPVQNLHVTSRGHGFVSLAWTPNFLEDEYTLTYFKKNENLEWVPVDTIFDVSNQTYTIWGIDQSTDLLIHLATNCSPMVPSTTPAVLELPKIILDLVVGGRIPVNPVPVSDCSNINLEQHWLGFKVSKNNTSIFSLFEVVLVDEVFKIKRVQNSNTIVAVDGTNSFPIIPSDLYKISGSRHRVRDLSVNDPILSTVGYVEYNILYNLYGIPIGAGWCIDSDSDPSWKSEYTFTAMKADQTVIIPPGGSGTGGGSVNGGTLTDVQVENPFTDGIKIFGSKKMGEGSFLDVTLFDISGSEIQIKKIDYENDYIEIPVNNLNRGFYILHINHESENRVFKLQKL